MNTDALIYIVHILFWVAFVGTRVAVSRTSGAPSATIHEPVAPVATQTAPYSRLLLVLHSAVFAVMYLAIGNSVIPGRVPHYLPGQGLIGSGIIALGAWVACWALTVFRSWRLRAKLDADHELVTDGPFRFVRHPIYTGLDLLALGTVVWIPTPLTGLSFVLMVLGGALRARSEEIILARSFGAAYLAYCDRTRRFFPGVY